MRNAAVKIRLINQQALNAFFAPSAMKTVSIPSAMKVYPSATAALTRSPSGVTIC